jgi:hypothetical protein
MDPREFNHADLGRGARAVDSGEDYRVELRVSVKDARSLWAAAAAKAMSVGLSSAADIEDTLGPCEDPSIADCLAILVEPAPIPGCELEQFAVALHRFGLGAAIAA